MNETILTTVVGEVLLKGKAQLLLSWLPQDQLWKGTTLPTKAAIDSTGSNYSSSRLFRGW